MAELGLIVPVVPSLYSETIKVLYSSLLLCATKARQSY